MSLSELRDAIDDVDGKIQNLLDVRLALAYRAVKIRGGGRDRAREASILSRAPDWQIGVFREILRTCRRRLKL